MRVEHGRGMTGDTAESHDGWTPPFGPADNPGRSWGDPAGRGPSVGAPLPEVAWYVPPIGRALMLLAVVILAVALLGGAFGIGDTASREATVTVPLPAANATIHLTGAASTIRVVPVPAGDAARASAVTVVTETAVRRFARFLPPGGVDPAPTTPQLRDGAIAIDAPADRGDTRLDALFDRHTAVTVYVPRGAPLDLRVRGGTVNLGGLTGPLTLDSTGGVLTLADLTLGDHSRLTLHGGSLALDGALATGASLDVTVSDGNATLLLPASTAARLDATGDGGLLVVGGWPGVATARAPRAHTTASGYLNGDGATVGAITLRLHGGNLGLHAKPDAPPPPPPPVAPREPDAPRNP